jgi:lipoic acid synthetase
VVDHEEPRHIVDAVRAMRLRYVVLTTVDRDDLEDGGAAHIARTIRELKASVEGLDVEILAGDFAGDIDAVRTVVDAGPDVFAHNIETVRRLQRTVRDARAGYEQSLDVLRAALDRKPDLLTKSSIMLGLSEAETEIDETLRDLHRAGVRIVTLGQYLQPTRDHLPVSAFVTPEAFARWKRRAEEIGFLYCASGPLVRSSYRAGELFVASHIGTRGT